VSVRCPGCLTSLPVRGSDEQGEIEWWGSCSHRADFVLPSAGLADLLENGVRCPECDDERRRLLSLRPRDCGTVLPRGLLQPEVSKAYCLVAGIGLDSHSAADNAAALLVWSLQRARLDDTRRWIYANDEASRIWRSANLRRHSGGRFGRAPLLMAILDAMGRTRAQAVMLVRSFRTDGESLEAWLAPAGCRRRHRDPLPTRLAAASQIVLAVRPEDLVGSAARDMIVAQAGILAGALGRQPDGRDIFLLLIDRDEQFLRDLGPGAATPRLCAESRDPRAWDDVAGYYVFHNYRLAELLAAGGLDRDAMNMQPLYGSLPAEDEASLLGIEPWRKSLLARLA
jgi:hypothetical protein